MSYYHTCQLSLLIPQSLVINGSNFGCGTGPQNPFGPTNVPVFITLNSTRYGGVALTSAACTHSSTSPSNLVTCITPPGVGANLNVILTAGGATAAPTAGNPLNRTGVSYAPPVIAVGGVTMPNGASGSPTAGGAPISILGSGFGPISYAGTAIDFVLYGHDPVVLATTGARLLRNTSGNASAIAALQALMIAESVGTANGVLPALPDGVFAANGCVVTSSDSMITCSTGPGTGSNLAVLISIGGQMPIVAPVPQAPLGYQPPQVLSFEPGINAGDVTGTAAMVITSTDGVSTSEGSPTVAINGLNLGPMTSYTNARLNVSFVATWSTGSQGAVTKWTYTPISCNVSISHTQLLCAVPPGGGANIAWTIVLDGQASALPYTSYNTPLIRTIQDELGNAAVALSALGGQWLTLDGAGFGPVEFFTPGMYSPLMASLTYGPTGTEYTAANFTVLS